MPLFKKRSLSQSPRGKNAVFDIHPPRSSGWNRPKETVSLRRHLYRRHPVLSSVGFFTAVLAAAMLSGAFLIHANTVSWYPKNCLGGWQYPENAAGRPETAPDAAADSFTAANSAVLGNTVSQMFCGNFEGDIPQGSAPQKVILKIFWTLKEGSSSSSAPGSLDPPIVVEASTSTDLPTTSIPSVAPSIPEEATPVPAVSGTPAPEPSESPAAENPSPADSPPPVSDE